MNEDKSRENPDASEVNSSFSVPRSSFPVRPAAMAPFDEAAQWIAGGLWPRAIADSGRPVVAVLCNLTPLELIHAAGAMPVRLCAGAVVECSSNDSNSQSAVHNRESESENRKSRIAVLPRDMCQVAKGAVVRLDALRKQMGRAPVAVVVPSTCDWKAQCCDFLGPSDEIRVLAVPRDRSSPRARREWRQQIAELADFLVHKLKAYAADINRLEAYATDPDRLEPYTAGTPISRRTLLRAIGLYQQATALGRRLADLMKQPHPPIAGADLMLVFNLFYSLPVEKWIGAASSLLEEMRHRLSACEAGGQAAPPTRLLLVGAPIIWPNWELPLLIESLGGQIVADALCSSYRGFSDLVSVDETSRTALIEALADRYLLPCTCPCFTSDEEYLWRVENQIADFRVEGAVIHRLKNCYLFDMEAKRLEDLFRKHTIPPIQIESDYESPASAALTTRIEAFLDLLKQKTDNPLESQ